jgi:hypothetical protein
LAGVAESADLVDPYGVRSRWRSSGTAVSGSSAAPSLVSSARETTCGSISDMTGKENQERLRAATMQQPQTGVARRPRAKLQPSCDACESFFDITCHSGCSES